MSSLAQRLEAERTIDLERYRDDGCDSRVDYLRGLAANHDLTFAQVGIVAEMMGPDEDFDGLVIMLEDQRDLVGEC